MWRECASDPPIFITLVLKIAEAEMTLRDRLFSIMVRCDAVRLRFDRLLLGSSRSLM